MTFEAPDTDRFPALALARDAAGLGPRATAALICADEVAVARFLGGSLTLPGIHGLTAGAVERFGDGPAPDVDELAELDVAVRAWAASTDTHGGVVAGGVA
jgi:1-deoxy-D-xylulose-5-phosphate reductoisomerase